MKVTFFLISLIAAAWVFYDARDRGKGIVVAFLWCIATQLLPVIVIPLWLIKRPERYQRVVVIR